ncbi:MAG TPA: DEAD/DEAH box helicase [Gemmataceae bacterium]|nr:DEAD/DEAH box helicase [Gemmataceae bacterium]
MLREEQIDIRRRRAAEEQFRIQNLGRNRVFSDYQISNPTTGGQYRVSIRGFDVGDNTCECPDFRTNTLGTCKHIEAVLASLREDTPPQLRRRKAAVTHPEVYLNYGEQLRIGLHLPPRHSDQLRALAEAFFDPRGLWKGGDGYQKLIELAEQVPEQVTIFSDAMDFMEREIERREMAQREHDLLEQMEKSEQTDGAVPEALRDLLAVPLYPYQVRGAVFLACRGRSILGDDMGLGKTVQTLAAVELLVRERGVERVLVVAPASVKYQWETEIRKYTGRGVQVIDGTAQERRALYRQPTFYRLINYEIAVRDLDELNAWQPDLIVLDEAQRIKNWEAKTTRAVKRLRSRYAAVLTGTPLENKLEELYSIVQFVDDRRLGPAFQFLHDHRMLDEDRKLLGYRNLDKIREKLAPILLRRTRAEVLSQLPARTDTTVFVEMADAQRGPYAEHNHTLARLLQKKYLTEIDRRRILASITNLRMLCDSTFLLDKQTKVSPKLEELEELLRELLGADPHKVVLFSQWELMLRQAAEVIEKLGIGFAVLHGGIPGKARRALLERFRDDPNCRVFLSTDAGGTGLNLQAADTVINLEVPWNPAVLEQRIARVHRMGQHRPVQVFNLVMRDSIEERVLRTLAVKRSLFAEIFTGTNEEVIFATLGQQAFLDTVRELLSEAKPAEAPVPLPVVSEPANDPRQAVVQAGVQLLEALAALVGSAAPPPTEANGKGVSLLTSFLGTDAKGQPVLQVPVPSPEMAQRGMAAIRAILQKLASSAS